MEESLEKEDRISSLPNCLIIEILSRLPYTKQATRTCIISKRWQHLWTSVHTLIFNEWFDVRMTMKYSISDYVSAIDKSLTECQSTLQKFKVSNFIDYDRRCVSPHVKNWIRCAINRNIQQLTLVLHFLHGKKFVLKDEMFFNTSCFTRLKLGECKFNPTGAISWKNLKSLCILDATLDEDMVQNILSGSPLLETLKLKDCDGFRRLDITSESVKNLFFYQYCPLDNIEINAPYVLSVRISMCSFSVFNRLSLLDVSSFVKVNLSCLFTTYKNDVAEEDVLKRFILKHSHVNEFNIKDKWSKVLSRLEAKSFILPSNLKVLDATSPLYYDSDSSDNDSSYGSESIESIDSEKLMPDDGCNNENNASK